jgi:hypothetical protein
MDSPAGVGSMPRRPRFRSATPTSDSRAAIRLLMADATMASRSAARAMLRSSQTAMNMRRLAGSKGRVIGRDCDIPR